MFPIHLGQQLLGHFIFSLLGIRIQLHLLVAHFGTLLVLILELPTHLPLVALLYLLHLGVLERGRQLLQQQVHLALETVDAAQVLLYLGLMVHYLYLQGLHLHHFDLFVLD